MIGGNGAGFFQNIDDQTKAWLHECFGERSFCINFPGGAEANLATPNPMLKGWGLTEENINKRFSAGSVDEDGNGIEKWMEKLRQQNLAPRSYLHELKDLKEEFPNMEVVWKVNLITGDTEEAKSAFSIVRTTTGCNKIVLGNEVYAKNNFAFDFSAFMEKAEPFIKWVEQAYPNIEVAIPVAPDVERPDHKKWNDAVISYLNTSDFIYCVDVHVYLTQDDLPEAFGSYPIQKINYHPLEEYPQLESCFFDFAEEYYYAEKWSEVIQMFYDYGLWCTEFNIKPSSYFTNTIAGGAYLFKTLIEKSLFFDVLCIHNLVSPDLYGAISRTTNIDYNQETANTRRVGYYALKFASEFLQYPNRQRLDGEIEPEVTELTALCFDGVSTMMSYWTAYAEKGYLLTPPSEHFISGEHAYDSFGKVGYMSNATEPFDPRMNITIENGKVYEIMDSEVQDVEAKLGFGYVVIDVKRKPKPCRKWWWQFWRRPCGQTADFFQLQPSV